MHVLDEWLKAVRADGLVLARTRVAGPWGFAVEAGTDVVFHFVAEGRAFVRRPDAAARIGSSVESTSEFRSCKARSACPSIAR